ncbi:hypothetical protein VC83_07867 [Pseudogymnoascus destructans]|uniref:Copper acquisition factor BIM1-like domain-containing protein n=2 Tax=Pseudogymnoascus destructans TaxID=655981 RepID=L8G3W7_PSED2|nr:uncharacterized protein VC83_07867 [Pseudogymnoascus destructans]ELR07363.1 hypothetical protein GMDG_08378 [Pseudogymnoascus destructans 20631-21]OAF55718.1 hypothetical protein VC83_07867 [Pseudogymnoascus destructans]
MKSLILLPALASLATAHYSIVFPKWRGDSFADGTSQWIYPCANVTQEKSNRTLWPLDGGALNIHLHHAWTYYAVNLGIGTVEPAFTTALTPELHNTTGNGTLCIPKLSVPAGLAKEGDNATVQVVTFSDMGAALYNCADITFSSKAVDPTDCKTEGVKEVIVGAEAAKTCTDSANKTGAAAMASQSTGGAVASFAGAGAGVLAAAVAVGLSVLV